MRKAMQRRVIGQLAGHRATYRATDRAARALVESLESRVLLAVTITATKQDVLATGGDADGDGRFDPGDTIQYDVVIANTGDTDATGVMFADLMDANTTLGTVRVSPLAARDSFNAVGNTPRAMAAGQGLRANDIDIDGVTPQNSLVVTAGTFPTTAGGSVTIAADGSFTYNPQVGDQNLADTFTYTITDADGLASTGTCTINLGQRVWYVDASAAAGGNGYFTTPFNSLAAVSGTPGPDTANDIIYVYERAGDYNGNMTLLGGQQLLGSGVALTVNTIDILPAGSATTLTTTAAATDAITLASGNTVRGFAIGNTTGAGIAGANVGALTINSVSDTGTGKILDLTGTAGNNVAVTLDTASTTSSASEAIELNGLIGSVTITAGAISGAAGNDVSITGGTAAISIGASITNTAMRSIVIDNHETGNVTFSAAINDTGGGILVQNCNSGTIAFTNASKVLTTGTNAAVTLTGNTGGTINFTGGNLDIDTTSGAGFTATGGGTVSVQGSNNTIDSTGATALNVQNTTIGAGGMTFVRVSSANSAAGIALNNAGIGGLTITGTSSTDGSGGIIQNTTGRGASFINTSNIALSNMTFTNAGTSDLDADNSGLSTGDNLLTNAAVNLQTVTTAALTNVDISGGAEQGINGNNVANFTLVNSTITNVGNGPDEDNIHFFNMSGSSAIINTTLTHTAGGGDDNLNLQTQAGNLDLVISGGSAVGVAGGVNQLGSGYLFGIRGATVANISFDGVSSTNNFSGGIVADVFDNATMNLRVNNSTSTGNNDQLSVSAGDNSSVELEATGNTLRSLATGDFVVVSLLGSAFDNGFVFDARIHNNTISVANGLTADGMAVFNAGGGVMNVAMTNNTIDYAGTQRPILFQTGQDGAGLIRATVTGNNIDIKLDGTGNAIGVLAQSAVTHPTGEGASINLNFGGAGALANVFTHSLGGTIAGGDICVRQRFDGSFNLDGYAGGALDAAAAAAYLNGRNTVVSPSTTTVDTDGGLGGPGDDVGPGFTGTISPAFITVSVAPASVPEDGGTNLVYTLTRSGSTASSLVANFAITGTASTSSDFTVTGATTFNTSTGLGTVTFAAGSATTTITVDPTADSDATEFDEVVVVDVGNSTTANGSFARGVITDDSPLILAPSGERPVTARPATGGGASPVVRQPVLVDDGILSRTELDALTDAAIAHWTATGLTRMQVNVLRGIDFSIADLPGWYLGSAGDGVVTLDTDAAGNSWFIDPTPMTDGDVPAGRIDLLTTAMHELGHQLGLEDSYLPADRHSLMYGYLTLGERRLPAPGQADGADPHAHDDHDHGPDFLFTPINVGTLTFGTTVRVRFTAQIANPLPVAGGASSVSNQGTVSGGNFTSVVTNDPDTAAANDATVTQVQPAAPAAAPDLQAASDTGSSNTDNLTNAASPVFDATGIDAAATVELLRGGTVVATRTGPGPLTDTSAPAGTQTYTIRQRFGAAGVNSDNSPSLTVNIDRTAPTVAPGVPDLLANSDNGPSQTDNITNDDTPTFDLGGTLEAGASLQLLRGTTVVATRSGPGQANDPGPAPEGAQTYTARQVDAAGNIGVASTGLVVTIDITNPSFPGPADLQAGSDSGVSNTDNITNDTSPTFDTTTNIDAGAFIELFRGGNLVATRTGAGALTDPGPLADGTYIYGIRQMDAAGNLRNTLVGLQITIDTARPTISGTPVFEFDTLRPMSVQYTFSEDVGPSLVPADIAVQNLTTASAVPDGSKSINYSIGNNMATLTFPGFLNGVLPDGNYRSTIAAANVTDVAGNAMAAASTFDFFFLAGDLNRDRRVDFDDLAVMAQNYNTAGKTFSQGNFNYDGTGNVDFDDLAVLAQRYNTGLAAPAPAPAAAPAPAEKPAKRRPVEGLFNAVTPIAPRPAGSRK